LKKKNTHSGVFGNIFIPDNGIIPKTIRDEGSFIRYISSAYAEIIGQDREGIKTCYKLSKSLPFKIVEQLDPHLLEDPPIEKEIIDRPFFIFGDTLKFKAIISNGGNLFSGQKLYVFISVDNKSDKAIDRISFALSNITTFRAPDPQGKNKEFRRRLPSLNAVVDNSKIDPKSKWEKDILIPIPHNIPGSIRFGSYIRREYELEINLEMPPIPNVILRFPILILEWSHHMKELMPETININMHGKPIQNDDEKKPTQ